VCSGTPSVEVSGGATSTANPLRPRSDSLGDISVAATFEATRAPGTASATASGAGIAAPIVVPLSSGGGPLSVTIRNVPAGANRWTQADTTGRGDGFNAAHLGRLTIN
ncbi:MAG: hypothetical protein FJ086_13425, partial [Deltaproteobacteria bacterium]|nr:hypothetical protein [Deltaproteobacteria bacterium]